LSAPDALVLGGGVAGLVAALSLGRRGLRPLLLEADGEYLGGRLKDGPAFCFEQQGRRWRFPDEHGIHGIWSGYANLSGLLADQGIVPALIPAEEEAWVVGRGALVRRAAIGRAIRRSPLPAPFHYLYCFARPSFLNLLNLHDLASLFRVFGGLCAAMAVDPLAERAPLTGMSLADFTRGWSPLMRDLFASLARSALAAHPEDVPVSGYIAFLRFYTLLRRDAWAFAYLPGTGGACIVGPLAEAARRQGATLRLGARVTRLERLDEGWRVHLEAQHGGPETIDAPEVVLALDAPAARVLLETSGLAGAERLRFPQGVATTIARLWFDRAPRPGAEAGIFSGDFVIDNFFWLHRLQPAYREWSAATGGSAIECHIYGQERLAAQPDAALLAQVASDLARVYPELKGHLVATSLRRNPPTHTLFAVGDAASHLAVETPWAGMFACGDWVYHPSPALYLERAAVTGIAAANALLAARGLSALPLRDSPAPEPLAGLMSRGLTRLRHLMLRQRRGL
jgi:carotenoid phi-ring synthase / carotenoid chi-ring synthase